ncbi:hypothetical protein RSP673_005890 [Ralstonia solanacearum P673]|uniref:hypothetical protein n=1 Tax=Ralstonia solanacearum TaxID=305 RepID=UPI00202A850E|nr:hypothetical protein [Ralstonia solanacearum]MCL9851997.1 hypothetical protein [Ralstonia solanacearum]MCL9857070.1 hypothetical protein [Ralstonia solanacearum]MCL9858576.1 hypothetical protein [Ralstonia solanacearum]MCL9866548.1 hypothetical protein [Ralstonia solanacearum]MCL9871324.1 hypothetical protein [Ralstonia solanacearum]
MEKNVTALNAECKKMAKNGKRHNLYRVQVYTEGHPHISEMIVTAESQESAADVAIGHVKEANPEKGRPMHVSQNNSKVLHVKKAGKNGAMVINKTPVDAFMAVSKAVLKRKKDD